MVREISLAEVRGLIGTKTGLSDWILVDQAMIDAFAHATNDHQFIHTDPARATTESSFGGTIAHGFLTLSLLSTMNYNALPKIREQTMGINYGFDKVRFMAPVKSGTRIRGHFILADARFRGASMLMTTYQVSIEIENEKKPALTANWITIIQFDPKDRPQET
ncbi:nodulation protein NodN [Rhizobium gallicum]|uniref:Nodulation protein NodN n=1 Tax=Rhizobium gallicum TaxID=56730 RepID=A0A1L5NMT7_9HYPH|nr:MaoC family dehydratase [Rhizobium gallicum]APO69220.1 nodulation protein NodN [Rhizobium gallicum]